MREMMERLGARFSRGSIRYVMFASFTISALVAVLLASISTAVVGAISFLGLIVPHMVRRMLGGGSLRLVAGCALCGAALLTFCDLVSRLAFAPFELPVGILLSFLGGPFFLFLLLKKGRGRIYD